MRKLAMAAAGVLAMGLLSCTENEPSGSVVLQLTSYGPGGRGPARLRAAGEDAVVALGKDTIFMRRVELVLQQIELAPYDAGDCEGSPDEHEEACTQLEPGMVLIRLPPGLAAQQMVTVKAPADTFSLLQFQIHKPDIGVDGAFISAHPDFTKRSIRLQGTFSRSGARHDFVYTSDFSEREELMLDPPLAVARGGTVGLTLRMDLATWFLTADKTALVDPASSAPGQPTETLIRDNIRMSIRAFRDDDQDGLDDHGEAGR